MGQAKKASKCHGPGIWSALGLDQNLHLQGLEFIHVQSSEKWLGWTVCRILSLPKVTSPSLALRGTWKQCDKMLSGTICKCNVCNKWEAELSSKTRTQAWDCNMRLKKSNNPLKQMFCKKQSLPWKGYSFGPQSPDSMATEAWWIQVDSEEGEAELCFYFLNYLFI